MRDRDISTRSQHGTYSARLEGLAELPPLTTRHTRIALTQKLRRIVDEGVGYGLALEGISAADIARTRRHE
jgi:hypothetical protein